MKIKKSELKKLIKEIALEELFHRGKTPKIQDMPEDEAIIDVWANLLDVASRDAKWTREIFDEVPEDTLMTLGFEKGDRDRPLSESPEAFKRQIMRAVGRDSGKKRDIKNSLIRLARNGEISRKWMLTSSGQADLVKKIANIPDPVAPAEPPAEPAAEPTTPDTTPTTAEPDVTPTTTQPPAGGVLSPDIVARARQDAKDELNKLIADPEGNLSRGQLRNYISQLGGRAKQRPQNVARFIARALKNIGVTELSESKLRKIILEEIKLVVKKSNKS